ncbi:MAG: hybrid sensor histidine kinase/response regulator [Mesorhizobium sp.]|uniref:ATP-binding response regulator n=1 Tax=Mesorhizobium sp. TaxID=1871066 RepID=UPI000FE35A04|nr:hybrid sensor histidine kinase/response regulator [Mesorhizobium sp.]RWJ04869.1 MAG: hybrid sensor histidine kinase/response regulator [Mesorhizobium sp.]RWJ11924.1 MAG: hybrid sensor histidine kinase/response regulator [Mesorhizobium sp.]
MTEVSAVSERAKAASAKIGRLTQQLTGSLSDEYDAERGQATTRVIIVPLAVAYIATAFLAGDGGLTYNLSAMLIYWSVYFPISWLLLYWIRKRPGYNLRRRIFAMANDYLAMTFGLAVGGAYTLPVYGLVLWVTVGNGLRFGPNYLMAATSCALASLGVAWAFNEYWRANPFVVLTLAMTAVLVPAYIFGLLNRLQTAYNMALEANLAKSRFLAQASHDLRQPIHSISLFTACLRDEGLNREQRSMVENIDRALQSVSRLFRSLLDISSLDSGKFLVQPETISLRDLFKELERQNAQAAQWANVDLRMVPSERYIRADRTLLTTMVQNIISNALKYARNGPVLVGCRRRRDGLAIAVYDKGKGIAEEHLPRVFEEFYRVRQRGDRDVDGVGLGLPIVRRLADLMGLAVSIQSRKGHGTGVVIEGLEDLPAPAVGHARPAPPRASTMLTGTRVLLVEDDEAALLATKSLLQKWGCSVQAETAVPRTGCDCDILVTDFDLGEKTTGKDCIERVRALSGREMPAIVMTGHDEARVRAELGDESVPILTKPVRPAELRSLLLSRAPRRRQPGAV